MDSFYFIDSLIEKYAYTNLILDFEGSSISGMARFYKGFGEEEEECKSVFLYEIPL